MPVDQTQLDPPKVMPEGRVHITTPNGSVVAGQTGPMEHRNGTAFVSTRDSHDHRLRVLDAYAFSFQALDLIEAAGVDYVLVYESDRGHTYEWILDAVLHADEVPDTFLEHQGDPQRYVPRKSARALWKNHSPFTHGDTPEDAEGFRRASNL